MTYDEAIAESARKIWAAEQTRRLRGFAHGTPSPTARLARASRNPKPFRFPVALRTSAPFQYRRLVP